MPNETDRLWRIVDALTGTARTEPWNQVGRSVFARQLGEGSVRIRSIDEDDSPPFAFELLNARDEPVETLTTVAIQRVTPSQHGVATAHNEALGNLYRTVRDKSLGLDDLLDSIEADLGLG